MKSFRDGLMPLLSLIVGALGLLFMPRNLMDIGSALGGWIELLPFGPEALPRVVFLCFIIYGLWQLFQLHILPLFAHRFHPWKNDRISMVEFAQIARRDYRWQLPGSLEILDFIDGIGQAFADGTVQAYGRFNPQRNSNLRTIYLVPIPRTYWRRHYLEAFDALNIEKNVAATSLKYGARDQIEYVDLHVNKIQAQVWLATEGKRWKGRTERQDKRGEGQTTIGIAAE